MSLQIREARKSDLPTLIEILEQVVAENRYLAPEPPLDHAKHLRRWHDLLADPASAMFVACAGDKPVGEIAITKHPEYGLLLGMILELHYRGRGAGSALLQAAIDWAAAHGHTQLSLLVFAHNKTAIALYKKFGFSQADYFKADVIRKNGEVWDTILMRRQLHNA